ncbi:sulfur carrier protein ThiS [Nitrogeniibacter mangrovi]|uniref:Sulfur carrier protein ThiS n=1 Tax=Nitrogeniibacter mangrovi TaxID=2016596 RepID=A0A6C1B422_9RHOO|nr:sulfur carrier protein ThiS [Nitrogeniibacter mangrovi]QID16944.1 sulfur carrier protein ThiS [Nitrogeniibacter mangrovi]
MNEIRVNDTVTDVPVGWRVADLLLDLGYQGKRVAVERNGEIVVRSHYEDTVLYAGDRLEIVVAVGGG